MAKVVTPITAKIEVVGKLKESSYAPGQYYRSVLFVDTTQPETSETYKIWKSLSDSECEGLVKGSTVQLVPAGLTKEGKERHNIVLLDDPVAAPHNETVSGKGSEGWTNEQKRAIAAKVDQHSDLLKYCLQVSRTKFDGLVQSEESFRTLATTLYLSVNK